MKTLGLLSHLVIFVALLPVTGFGQGLDPRKLLQPATDTWPTYNGDYSGRRYSTLAEINSSNVESLGLAWMYRVSGVDTLRGVGAPDIKSTPLLVGGVLYFTVPDHVYAVDVRTGRELSRYDPEDHGGQLVGNRGIGMRGDLL